MSELELQILDLYVQGKSQKEVATITGYSLSWVEKKNRYFER